MTVNLIVFQSVNHFGQNWDISTTAHIVVPEITLLCLKRELNEVRSTCTVCLDLNRTLITDHQCFLGQVCDIDTVAFDHPNSMSFARWRQDIRSVFNYYHGQEAGYWVSDFFFEDFHAARWVTGQNESVTHFMTLQISHVSLQADAGAGFQRRKSLCYKCSEVPQLIKTVPAEEIPRVSTTVKITQPVSC